MKTRVEEIISRYIDGLNTGRAQPVDVFLAQYSDLPIRMATGLHRILVTLTLVHNQLSDGEENVTSLGRVAEHLGVRVDQDEEAITSLAASVRSPTVGEYLSQTLAENPAALSRFTIPQQVLLTIAQDDSLLETMQESAEQRFRFAQSYAEAAQDQSLLRPIGGLLTYLSRMWLSGIRRSSRSPSFARPASHDPHND